MFELRAVAQGQDTGEPGVSDFRKLRLLMWLAEQHFPGTQAAIIPYEDAICSGWELRLLNFPGRPDGMVLFREETLGELCDKIVEELADEKTNARCVI